MDMFVGLTLAEVIHRYNDIDHRGTSNEHQCIRVSIDHHHRVTQNARNFAYWMDVFGVSGDEIAYK